MLLCSGAVAPSRRRANAASRRACNLNPLRAYIANINSGLRIYPDDRAGVRCFSVPLGHPRGRAVALRGRFAKIRTATAHYGLYLRECVVFAKEPYSGVPAA